MTPLDMGPTTTALVLALFAVHRGIRRGSARWLLAGGAAAGFAIALRLPSVICVPLLGLYLLVSVWRLGRMPAIRRLLAFGVPVVAFLLVIGVYNWVRFGDPLQSGYAYQSDYYGFASSPQDGVIGLLFSPGRSIFLYSPILLASVAGLPLLWRRHRALTATVVAIVLANLVFYGDYLHWWGDWSWGPRFLVPMTPFLILPLLPLLQRWRELPRAVKGAISGLAVAGVVVQLFDVTVDFQNQFQLLRDAGVEQTVTQWWAPQYSGSLAPGPSLRGSLQRSPRIPPASTSPICRRPCLSRRCQTYGGSMPGSIG